jgi:hypothetical protein
VELELEAEGSADGQILLCGLGEPAHDRPAGHGRASADNAARSTLA